MTFDLTIEGGLVVDGTGGPARAVDVGIRGERIVALAPPGELEEQGARRIDATGLVVAPGFIDIHTHLDAQVFWDPSCSPVLQHGVTTVIAGNCGFSIAPITDAEADYVIRMLASVEDIPLDSLRAGVRWDWRSMDEFLARVEAAAPIVNMGFMVGHSAIRRVVMGADAVGEAANAAQVAEMGAHLRQSLLAGGMGFSSSWQTVHVDGDGQPVPSRWASDAEIIALCEVVGETPGTHVEFIPQLQTHRTFDDERVDLLTRMSLAAGRAVNWNIFQPRSDDGDATLSQLRASRSAAQAGARVVALSYPGVQRSRRTFLCSPHFAEVPAWAPVVAMTVEEKLRLLSDAESRTRLREGGRAPLPDGTLPEVARLSEFTVMDTAVPANTCYEGRRVGDIAAEEERDPFDVMADIAAADGMRAGFFPPPKGDDPAAWAIREDSWRNPDVIMGASDAGAHVQSLSTFDWATTLLALNRERVVFTLEEAVHKVTGVQAALYGLVDRGRIATGCYADLTIFDADRIEPEPARWREDLPAGAGRLYGVARGLHHVIVNGTEVLRGADVIGDQPGRVLRSGRDTVTVPLP